MDDPDLDTSLADWVIEHPATAAIFDELAIDYCCGGRSLRFACQQQSLDPAAVLRRLQAAAEAAKNA